MKKILYITCNSKPESISASKTVAKYLLEEVTSKCKELEIKEIDLYKIDIPQLRYEYFDFRSTLVKSDKLDEQGKNDITRIKAIAEEFKTGDYYIIAAPLWNMKSPGPLSNYIDCISLNGITIEISKEKIGGLLDDKNRKMIFVQSSGGYVTAGKPYAQENHPGVYLKEIFGFMGIKDYYEVLVENTGYTEEEKQKAIDKGKEDSKKLVNEIISK